MGVNLLSWLLSVIINVNDLFLIRGEELCWILILLDFLLGVLGSSWLIPAITWQNFTLLVKSFMTSENVENDAISDVMLVILEISVLFQDFEAVSKA